MRLLFTAALALGFMSLPAHAQGLSIAIVWDESRDGGANCRDGFVDLGVATV